jgi:hypothetical protein
MKLITNLMAIVCSLIPVGLVFPYGFPLIFPLVFAVFLLYALHTMMANSKIYIINELVLIYSLMMIFLLWGGIHSDRLYMHFVQDLVNATMIFLLIPIFSKISKCNLFDNFKLAYAKANLMLLFPVSLYCLYKFYQLLHGVQLDKFVGSGGRPYPWGTALQSDYNMGALGLLIGVVSGLYLFRRTDGFLNKTCLILASMTMFIAAMLTGSRRMYLVFVLMVGCFVFYPIYKLIKNMTGSKLQIHKKIGIKRVLVILIILSIPLFIYTSMRQLSSQELDEGSRKEMAKLTYRIDSLFEKTTFYESRGLLMYQAIDLIDDFTIFQLFCGNGFNYLSQLASSSSDENYPHNPVFASFLYGGFFGVVLTFWFIARSFFLYIRNLKEEKFLLILFILTFIFMSISSNTVFSSRLFLILIVIGYLLPERKAPIFDLRKRKT